MRNNIISEDISTLIKKVDFSELDDKKIMITGATGLIGTYLLYTIKALWENGIKVQTLYIVVHDDIPKHLYDFSELPWVTILKGDLAEVSFLNSLPKCDFAIHAAGYGQPGKFVVNPDKTIKINTLATFYILDCLHYGGKAVFISTSEVYSGLGKKEYEESDIGTTTPQSSRACYIEGKRCGEAICQSYRDKGVDVKSIRLSLAYGPGTKNGDKRVLNEFIMKAFCSGRIELMDTGIAKRTYCYVLDAIEMIWKVLFIGKEPVYNVGGHSTISIVDLAKKIGEIIDVPVLIPSDKAGMVGAPIDVCMNMSLTETTCNKKEYVPLDDGIQKTICWQREWLYNKKKERQNENN